MIDTRRPEPKCPHGFPASRCNLQKQVDLAIDPSIAPPIPADFAPEEHHFTAGEIAYINSDGDSHTARMARNKIEEPPSTAPELPPLEPFKREHELRWTSNLDANVYLAKDIKEFKDASLRQLAQLQEQVAKLTIRNERLTEVHDLALTSALQEDPRYFKERVLQEWEKDTHRVDDLQRTIAQLQQENAALKAATR